MGSSGDAVKADPPVEWPNASPRSEHGGPNNVSTSPEEGPAGMRLQQREEEKEEEVATAPQGREASAGCTLRLDNVRAARLQQALVHTWA